MRAFLSHSSSNKSFVGEVFQSLGAASAEYDEATFSAGAFNTEAIREALLRSDIFVLFATTESLASGFVAYEILIANEYLAAKRIKRIITFCLGDVTPENLPSSLRSISAVRRVVSVGAAIRTISAELIELQISASPIQNAYLGRENLTRDIKNRLATPDEKTPVAIAFSGVDGVGRRTLASRVLSDVYPGTGKVHPSIKLNINSDRTDIFRSLLEVSGGLTKVELFNRVSEFDGAEKQNQYRKIIELIREFNSAKEIIYVVDNGGLLDGDGKTNSDLKEVISLLITENNTIPYFAFILFRTPPAGAREKDGVFYFKVDAIETDDIKNLVALHIKQKGQLATSDDVARLVDLTDGHPYNLQFLLRLLDTHTIRALIDDPADLIAFKRRQGDDFVSRISLGDPHFQVLGTLRTFGQASIELLGAAVALSPEELGRCLRELEEYHCIERVGNICAINRPLRTAFDRSSHLKLSLDQISRLQSEVVKLFDSYKSDDEVGIELVSAAARAAVFLNKEDKALAAFLSPSNSLFVARQLYDHGKYRDCARVALKALSSPRFISDAARTEAIRLRCSSLARLGEDDAFADTLAGLGTSSGEKAIKYFLEGFRLRIKGEPEPAVDKFRASYGINKTSFATLRELSHALMQIGEVEEAKQYAEQALDVAPTNPYIIDQALALRVADKQKVTKDIVYEPSIEPLLARLERYGDEEGKSFYAIRMSDIMRRAGETITALDFAVRASRLTPSLAAAHIAEADILIKLKRLPQARRKIDQIQKLIDDRTSGEGKSQLPEYIVLKANYLIENEEYSDAVSLLKAHERRVARRLPELKRRISFLVAGTGRVSPNEQRWLSSD